MLAMRLKLGIAAHPSASGFSRNQQPYNLEVRDPIDIEIALRHVLPEALA